MTTCEAAEALQALGSASSKAEIRAALLMAMPVNHVTAVSVAIAGAQQRLKAIKQAADSHAASRAMPGAAPAVEATCVVCMEQPKSHLAAPCGHICACGTCAAEMNTCPYCREPVAMWVRHRMV